MDLIDLAWWLIGTTLEFGPYLVAAMLGLALPLVAVGLAQLSPRWPDSTKLAVVMGGLVLIGGLSVAVSARVFYTDTEVALNPMLTFAKEETGGAPWVNRLGTLILFAVALPELLRWLFGQRQLPTGVFPLLGALLLYFLVSVVMAGIAGQFRGSLFNALYLPLVAIAVALLSSADPTLALRGLRLSLWGVMVGSLVAAWLAPMLALERDYGSMLPGLSWRLVGLSEHAVSLGVLAVLALVLELSPRGDERASWIFWLPALAVLVLAQSKTAWVEALLCLFLVRYDALRRTFFGSQTIRAPWLLLATVMLVVALALASLGWLLSSDRALDWIDHFGLTTLTGRTHIWELTLAEFERSPWLGFGPALWDIQYRYERGLMYVGQAHNQYIHTLGQAGIAGALALALYLGVMLRNCWRAWARGNALPLVVCLILLIRGITETPLTLNGLLGTDAFLHLLAFWLAAHAAHTTQTSAEDEEAVWQEDPLDADDLLHDDVEVGHVIR